MGSIRRISPLSASAAAAVGIFLAFSGAAHAQNAPADPVEACMSLDPCTALINGGALSQVDLARALASRSFSLLQYGRKDEAAADADRAKGILTGLIDGGTLSQFDLARALTTRAGLAPDDAPDGAIADYSRAIDILRKTGGHAPELGMALYQRSLRYEARGEPKAQVADLIDALKAVPTLRLQHTLALAYEDLSLYFRKLGNFDGAIKAATSALTYDPNEDYAYVLRGNMKRFISDYVGAGQDFEAALRLNPKSPLAHIYLGEMIYSQDQTRYEETIRHYEQAIAVDARFAKVDDIANIPWAYIKRGQALKDKGDLAGEIEALNHAIALRPGIVEAYNNRGVAYYEMRQYAAAIADLNRALQLRPDFAKARENLAVVQQAQQREQERLAQQQLAQQQARQQAQAAERQRQQQAAAEQQRRQAQNNASSNALTRLILGGVAAAAGADANTVASTLNGTYSAPPPAPVPQPGYQQPAQQPGYVSVNPPSQPGAGSSTHSAAVNNPANDATSCLSLQRDQYGQRVLHNSCPYSVEAVWCVVGDGCGQSAGGAMWTIFANKNYPILNGSGPQVRYGACRGANSLETVRGAPNDGMLHYICP
jgi:tetratricopeptide (TPR) repeat protein